MTRTVESLLPEVVPSIELPDLWQYAIRKKCRKCGAPPMTACHAPLINKEADRQGLGPHNVQRLHYRRVRAGHRNRLWDLSVGAPEAFDMLSAGVA